MENYGKYGKCGIPKPVILENVENMENVERDFPPKVKRTAARSPATCGGSVDGARGPPLRAHKLFRSGFPRIWKNMENMENVENVEVPQNAGFGIWKI